MLFLHVFFHTEEPKQPPIEVVYVKGETPLIQKGKHAFTTDNQGMSTYYVIYLSSVVPYQGYTFYEHPRLFVLRIVAANHENDTCFQVGLVMGIADCIIYAGLDKIP